MPVAGQCRIVEKLIACMHRAEAMMRVHHSEVGAASTCMQVLGAQCGGVADVCQRPAQSRAHGAGPAREEREGAHHHHAERRR
jgi:hypothetical protein